MDKTTPDFLVSWLGRWLGRIKLDGTRSHWMASVKRISKATKAFSMLSERERKFSASSIANRVIASSMKKSLAQALRVGHQPEPMQNALAESMVKS